MDRTRFYHVSLLVLGLASASVCGVTAGFAEPIQNGTVAGVTAQAQSTGGQQFNYTDETIVNGTVTARDFNQSTSGSSNGSASVTAGGSRTAPTLSITQDGYTPRGQMNSTTSTASANLSTGAIKLLVSPSGGEFYGSPSGYASGTVGDDVHFTNNTGRAVTLGLTFAANGIFIPPVPLGDAATHQADAYLEFYTLGGPNAVQIVTQSGGHNTVGDYYAHYQLQGQYNPLYTNFSDNGGGGYATLVDHSTSTSLHVIIGATLYIPTGGSSIDIGARLDTACAGAWACDISHTGLLSLAPLPSGLSYTSDSGVFLNGPVSAVPELSTWAMMILGFAGLSLATARRRGGGPHRWLSA